MQPDWLFTTFSKFPLKRIKEYGTLRAIGGEQGRYIVLFLAALDPLRDRYPYIGLVLGTLSAKGVLIAATSVLNPDIFMVIVLPN